MEENMSGISTTLSLFSGCGFKLASCVVWEEAGEESLETLRTERGGEKVKNSNIPQNEKENSVIATLPDNLLQRYKMPLSTNQRSP